LSICYRALLYKIREAGLPPNRSSRKPPEEVVNPQVWKWWLVAKIEVRANNFMRSDFGNAILVSNVLSAVTTFFVIFCSARENSLHCALFCARAGETIEGGTDVALREGLKKILVWQHRCFSTGVQ
jgi:hypothetical protein